MRAYCHASGEICFGHIAPDGAVQFAAGPVITLIEVVEVLSRLSYDHQSLLVPGVPEANNIDEAVSALTKFSFEVMQCLKAQGVTTEEQLEILLEDVRATDDPQEAQNG